MTSYGVQKMFGNYFLSFSAFFQEEDPFAEDLNQEVHIGTVQVFLQPIAYMVRSNSIFVLFSVQGDCKS